ncbi:MAG: Bor/Iss family lipoprotein [Gemmatimonadales bacterium]
MSRMFTLAATSLLLVLPACYHATIQTGLPAGSGVVEQKWAAGWLWGLVPPKPVATMAQCPTGVSKVETQHSFLNMVVQALTAGIFTPMSIKATCASGGAAAAAPEIRLGAGASSAEVIDAFRRAADLAVASDSPVYVRF